MKPLMKKKSGILKHLKISTSIESSNPRLHPNVRICPNTTKNIVNPRKASIYLSLMYFLYKSNYSNL